MKLRYIAPIVVGAAVTAIGYRYAKSCESVIEIGIHFHAGKVDFGAPPPRFQPPFDDEFVDTSAWRASSLRRNEDYNDDPAEDAKTKHAAWNKKLKTADQLALDGHYSEAIAAYRTLNKAGSGDAAYCTRRVALLHALNGHSADKSIQALLLATSFDSKTSLPDSGTLPANLGPYVEYEKASRAYDTEQYPQATTLYRTCAKEYPNSELADAALIMAARSGLQGDTVEGLNEPANDLQMLITQYPHSRFKVSALGWKARIAFLQQKYGDAISLYKLQLGCNLTHDQRLNALTSIVRCDKALGRPDLVAADWIRIFGIAPTVRPNVGPDPTKLVTSLDEAMYSADKVRALISHFTPTEAAKLADELKSDPNLLATYIQLRLEMTRTDKKERSDLARIAKACPTVPAKLLARLAQIAYSDNEMADCQTLAARAADGSNYGTEEWGIAHYLLGTMAQRSGQSKTAEKEYKLVASVGPKDYLAVGARESLAYLYDRQGKLGDALDQLYWLSDWSTKYKGSSEFTFDIAYMLDAKMTPGQLERYLSTHPGYGHKQLLRYTIGLRYLRENKFSQAERSFASLTKKLRLQLAQTAMDDRFFDPGPIQDPMQTAKDLAHLSAEANSARGAQAKAKKLMVIADYYYYKRTLLLYNAPLWRAYRASAFGFSWNPQTASKADNTALTRHHLEHECLQHAVDICSQILRKYPKTEAAPVAAYRAACAEERLSNFNPWWRWEAGHDGLLDKAVSYMNLVSTHYPKSPLAAKAMEYGEVFKEELKEHKKNAPTGGNPLVFAGSAFPTN